MSKTNADVVAERRLRPIYDWLDLGNNKKALQEADKVLKKQPDLLCAKVLKGLALLRLGKSKDCEDILENVKEKVPADDCTLQAMTICYRELHRSETICEIYEKAVPKDPLNEELNTHLFMAYVRVSDFKKQQQAALNLYKLKPKNPYYFWGVMSIMMQARNSDEKVAQQVLLPLAERMVKKFLDEGKIETEQEIQLYIMILEMRKRYQEALEVLESDLGLKILSHFTLSRKRIKLLGLVGRWHDLNIYSKKLLLEEPDAYNFYVAYVDSTLKLLTLTNTACDETDALVMHNSELIRDNFNKHENELLQEDCSIEACRDFLQKCQERTASPYKHRGPHLAMLYLYKKLVDEGYEATKYLGESFKLFKNYFKLFGDKPCCFKDLHQFLPLIGKDYITLLSSTWELLKNVDEGDVKNVDDKKQMMMYLTHFELSRYFGIQEMYTGKDKLTQVSRLLDFYHNGHRFNLGIASTDLGCSDMFMVLVVHSLHDLYIETGDFKFVKDAICLLEYAFGYSSSNHHFKLLLVKLYNTLGASKAAYRYFQLLEIRHMQYDSLGYLHCWSLLYSGQYSLAIHLLDNTLKFFNINYKEAADQLTYAYKYGSFEKVTEFLNFRERLKNSSHFSLATIEHLINDLIHLPSHEITIQTAQQLSINPEKPMAESKHLVDNRDVQLFLNFDADSKRMNEKFTKLSFEHDVALIRLRTMLLRCLGASIDVSLSTSHSSSDSQESKSSDQVNAHDLVNGVDKSVSKHLDTFNNVIEELRQTYKSFLENPPERIPDDVFSGVECSRLFLYVKSSFFLPIIIDAMALAYEFCSLCLMHSSKYEYVEKMAQTSSDDFSKLMKDCDARISKMESSPQDVDYRREFEYFALVIEIICMLSIICGNLYSALVMSNKKMISIRKKKKKGKEATPNSNSANDDLQEGEFKIYVNYMNVICNHVKTFEASLGRLDDTRLHFELRKPGFELRRWQSNEEEDEKKTNESSPNFGISDEKWFQVQTAVNENIVESYKSSIKQFRNVLKYKAEYFVSLTF